MAWGSSTMSFPFVKLPPVPKGLCSLPEVILFVGKHQDDQHQQHLHSNQDHPCPTTQTLEIANVLPLRTTGNEKPAWLNRVWLYFAEHVFRNSKPHVWSWPIIYFLNHFKERLCISLKPLSPPGKAHYLNWTQNDCSKPLPTKQWELGSLHWPIGK